MTNLVNEAKKRIAELEAELNELHQFVAVADRLSSGRRGPVEVDKAVRRPPAELPSTRAVDAYKGSPTKEIIAGLFDVLSQSDETIDRDALIQRLAERNITIPGMYPNKNLATILWRNQSLFEHVQGEGYRWTGVSLEDGSRKRPTASG